ncbi:MAG: DUF4097 family beta strand repeat protein [Actinomycetia bacterium]|nr:DUF4097 family beta strand repeat protein [Actinomycetes bacterium]
MIKKYESAYYNINTILIKGAMFDIDITGQETESVSGRIETSDADFILVPEQKGGTLQITFKKPLWKPPIFKVHDLVLKVPHSVRIKIENTSGKVTVNRIQTAPVISTTSGDITISEITSGNGISLNTTSGDIKAGDINASINTRTTSGEHLYENIEGSIMAIATSGEMNINTHKGTLSLTSTSGRKTGKNITLTGDSIFKSTSGNIDMDLINPHAEFTFNLRATTGELQTGDQKGKRELSTGSGKITITGMSTTGNQSY